MDFLNTIYSFNPTIAIIMIVGIVICVIGAIVGKDKRILYGILLIEGMYAILVYLGMKLGYLGVLIFLGIIMVLTIGVYLVQKKRSNSETENQA